MRETIKIVTDCEINFDIAYAVERMLGSLDDDLECWTDGCYRNCVNDLPPETKEHLRDEILKEVLKRF